MDIDCGQIWKVKSGLIRTGLDCLPEGCHVITLSRDRYGRMDFWCVAVFFLSQTGSTKWGGGCKVLLTDNEIAECCEYITDMPTLLGEQKNRSN